MCDHDGSLFPALNAMKNGFGRRSALRASAAGALRARDGATPNRVMVDELLRG